MNSKGCIVFLFLFIYNLTISYGQLKRPSFKFDFGSAKVKNGFIGIKSSHIYSDEIGYGFDFNTMPDFIDRNTGGALKRDFVISEKPFYFSVKVPEGNYKISITLGDLKGKSITTVKAESRRLMLENIETKHGEIRKESFVVNVKDKRINTQELVGLKSRELTKLDWDDKLTIEFNLNPAVISLEIEPVEDQITFFLAGNSTVVNQEEEPWASWGQMIPVFFKPGISIANHAESGLTLGSFLNSRRLKKIMSVMKPGDYLFIEFGHNDQKDKGVNDGAYKSYTERLKLFVNTFKDKGGNPIILTSTSRRAFDTSGNLQQTLGDFPDAAKKVATELNVPLIDLNLMTKLFYEALGVEGSKKALVHYPANSYPGQATALADNTHFNPYGAYQIAKMVVEGIKSNNLEIKKYIKIFPDYDPFKPDDPRLFIWPESPKSDVLKPDGN